MKTISTIAITLLFCIASRAAAPIGASKPSPNGSAPASTPPQSLPAAPGKPQSKPYHVTDRGANYRVWQHETSMKLPDGHVVPVIHKYTEVASGLNYQNGKGEWLSSKEIIEAFPGGAIARQGQYQVIFANNLNSSGAIDLQGADGKRLRSNILGARNGLDERLTVEGVYLIDKDDRNQETITQFRGRERTSVPHDDIHVHRAWIRSQALQQQIEISKIVRMQKVRFHPLNRQNPAQFAHQVAICSLHKNGLDRLSVREASRLYSAGCLSKFLLDR